MFSFGRNQSGQCGHVKLHTFNTPKLIEGLSHANIVQAAAGAKHSLFLTDEGVVYVKIKMVNLALERNMRSEKS